MRLIDTRGPVGLKEVIREKSHTDVDNISYAILSHTWGPDEVKYDDFLDGTEHQQSGKSLQKIRNACRQAAADGHDYLWIDTCCIDKRSSAEL